jgi:hypothetical protein
MTPLPNAASFELCKVILQLVFADLELSDAEATYVRRLSEQLKLNGAQQAALETWLAGTAPLPAPDFTILRAHSADVLRCAAGLVVADGEVLDEERDVLHELAQMLH